MMTTSPVSGSLVPRHMTYRWWISVTPVISVLPTEQ
jgi:hypothetical protein